MKVEKEKRRVAILCREQALLKGTIHVNPGERTFDFLNDTRRMFLVLTEVEFKNVGVGGVQSFKLYSERNKKTKVVIINKSDIKWVEELN